MIIETDRLYLMPLTARQLKHWIEDITALEEELGISYRAEPMEGHFFDVVKSQLYITEKDESNYLYHSFWFLVRRTDRVVVGSADFKDMPNSDGEVEIGYGLGNQFEHNGYMTEAVRSMCEWAMKQQAISHIIAETDVDGVASQRVLERCGFKLYKKDKTLWWRL